MHLSPTYLEETSRQANVTWLHAFILWAVYSLEPCHKTARRDTMNRKHDLTSCLHPQSSPTGKSAVYSHAMRQLQPSLEGADTLSEEDAWVRSTLPTSSRPSAPEVETGILPPHPQGLQKHSRKSDFLTRFWICKFGINSIDHKDLRSSPSWKRVGIRGMSCWATGGCLPPPAGWCCAAVALPTTHREHTNLYHN